MDERELNQNVQTQEFIFFEPNNYEEAMKSNESELRKKPLMKKSSHYKNNTWTMMPLPASRT